MFDSNKVISKKKVEELLNIVPLYYILSFLGIISLNEDDYKN